MIVEYGQEPRASPRAPRSPWPTSPTTSGPPPCPGSPTARWRSSEQPTLVVGTDVKRQTGSGAVRSTGMTVFVFVSMTDVDQVLVNLRAALLQAGSLRSSSRSRSRCCRPARSFFRYAASVRPPAPSVPAGSTPGCRSTAATNSPSSPPRSTRRPRRWSRPSRSCRRWGDVAAVRRRRLPRAAHPLTTMTAVTDMLSDEAERLPPDAGQAVHLVVAEIERLRSLVDDLIEVSRFDSGAAVLRRETVDVGDELTECSGDPRLDRPGDAAGARRPDLPGRPAPLRRHRRQTWSATP